jgi:hypothetical protein
MARPAESHIRKALTKVLSPQSIRARASALGVVKRRRKIDSSRSCARWCSGPTVEPCEHWQVCGALTTGKRGAAHQRALRERRRRLPSGPAAPAR